MKMNSIFSLLLVASLLLSAAVLPVSAENPVTLADAGFEGNI